MDILGGGSVLNFLFSPCPEFSSQQGLFPQEIQPAVVGYPEAALDLCDQSSVICPLWQLYRPRPSHSSTIVSFVEQVVILHKEAVTVLCLSAL